MYASPMRPIGGAASGKVITLPYKAARSLRLGLRGALDKAKAPIAKCYERFCGRGGWR